MAIRPLESGLSSPLIAAAPDTDWQVVGASVRGISHERLNMPCQDAQGHRVLPNGVLLIAAADGAGSARFSDEGARCAVKAALLSMETALERDPPLLEEGERILRESFAAARQAVLNLAEAPQASTDDAPKDRPSNTSFGVSEDALSNSPFDGSEDVSEETPEDVEVYSPLEAKSSPMQSVRDFACTLTCVIVGAGELVVGQIGDGAVVAVGDDGRLFSASRLQRGEYANETHFITQVDALDQAVIEVLPQAVQGLAVMSDGLIRLALKMPSQEPHTPFFQPLFQFARAALPEVEAVRQLEAFLQSERVNARTDDDKTLVLAIRRSAAAKAVDQKPVEQGAAPAREPGPMENQSSSGEESPLDQEAQ